MHFESKANIIFWWIECEIEKKTKDYSESFPGSHLTLKKRIKQRYNMLLICKAVKDNFIFLTKLHIQWKEKRHLGSNKNYISEH